MKSLKNLAVAVFATTLGTGVSVAQTSPAAQTTSSAAQATPAAQTSQAAPHPPARTTELIVNGYDGQADVIHRNGHAYVEVEGFARVTGAALQFQGKSIFLTLPAPAPAEAAAQPATAPAPPEEKGFSREFLRSGVEQMTVVREWRSAIENAVRTNNPVDESWISGYRQNAENRMAMARASATTDADRQALPLLDGATGMVQQLSDRFLALRKTVSYVDPTTLNDDPLDKKILACAQGMAAIAIPGGQFQDVNACH
jgi:hypothetical protein